MQARDLQLSLISSNVCLSDLSALLMLPLTLLYNIHQETDCGLDGFLYDNVVKYSNRKCVKCSVRTSRREVVA
jgi:hypothetical protein